MLKKSANLYSTLCDVQLSSIHKPVLHHLAFLGLMYIWQIAYAQCSAGKAPPESLGVTSCQEGFPPEDLGSYSFQGPGDYLPVEGGSHILGITTLHKDAASLCVGLILSPWLCYPHFVRTLELFGPLPR